MKAVAALILITAFLPYFALAQDTGITAPEDLEGIKELGGKALDVTKKEMPGIVERIWEKEVLPIWQKMYQVWLNFWNSTIKPRVEGFWEQRKGLIQEEFEKEKGEMTEELKTEGSKVGKSLWDKFKDIIK